MKFANAPVEEGLGYLAMAWHSDTLVSVLRAVITADFELFPAVETPQCRCAAEPSCASYGTFTKFVR